MPDGFSISADFSQLEQRLGPQLLEKLGIAMQEKGQQIGRAVMALAAEKAPSPELEESLMMGTEGLSANRRRELAGEANRVRFTRTHGQLPIAEALLAPGNVSVGPNGMSLEIGDLALLNELTRWTWINATKDETYTHESVGGTFSLFEFGADVTINPRFATELSIGPLTRVPDIQKTIPAFSMFTTLDEIAVRNIVAEQLSGVQF